MKVRGAPLISVVALQGLKIELQNSKESLKETEGLIKFIVDNSEYLKTSRPTAVNLSNDLESLVTHLTTVPQTSVAGYIEEILRFIENNYTSYEESCKRIAVTGAELILANPKLLGKKTLSVLTICNTGKLATPGPGTALGIVRELHARGRLEKLYIPETRPYNQGSRLTATEAVHDKLPGVLIADSMAGWLMANGKVDVVVVGADRVTHNGATANKIGTYTFAVLAQHHSIPFYVACPLSTVDEKITSGLQIKVEERPGDELRKVQGLWLAPHNIEAWNPSFDVTPSSLIEKVVTEKGEYSFDKTLGNWYQLDQAQLESYLKEKLNVFEKDEKLEISDVADGNLNLVYCVKGKNRTLCVKQALPWVKCVGPQWQLSLKRALFEAESLKYEHEVVPELVPAFVHYNEDLYLIVMEFLVDHIILRKGLINGVKYERIGLSVGDFVAKTCFLSSGLHLKAAELREKMSFWNQNTLCELTEQVIFLDPYIEAPFNRWTTPHLDDIVSSIKSDEEMIISIAKLRHKFITHKQALIHADLHTGSIMVNNSGSHKVIDSEFAFYGPIGFDTGAFISNLLMNYFSQRGHSNSGDFGEWVLGEIISFWNRFCEAWINLWNDENLNKGDDYPRNLIGRSASTLKATQNSFLNDLWIDTVGFSAAKIIRRILGIAHNADFETIADPALRADCERRALKLARVLLVQTHTVKNPENLVALARSFNE